MSFQDRIEIDGKTYDALIASIASPGRDEVWLELANMMAGVDEIFGYELDADAMTPVISAGRSARARDRVSQYVTRFYAFDPALIALSTLNNRVQTFSVRVGSRDIDDPEYRYECFEKPRFSGKASFALKAAARWRIISFYWMSESHANDPTILARASSFARTALPLFQLGGARITQPVEARIADRLKNSFPSLTFRELEVCARTLAGRTAEMIASDLDIKLSTVLTYRRRAYLRLGVSSANELLADILH